MGGGGRVEGEGVPVATDGELGAGLQFGGEAAGAVHFTGVLFQPARFFAEEFWGSGVRRVPGEDDFQAAPGVDLDGGVLGAGGASDGVGGESTADEDGLGDEGGVV